MQGHCKCDINNEAADKLGASALLLMDLLAS